MTVLALLIAAAATPTPREILDRVDDLFRGNSSHGKMTMRVVTAQYTRELSLEQWSLGKDRFLIRILAPLKEKGTATLKAAENIWNYLPKVERVIKVPPSMMAGTWMGSHFTNDDLVKQSRMADDYTARQSFEGERDGEKILELELLPRPDAAVVWGKIVVTVRSADLLPLRMQNFDEDLALARTVVFSDYRVFGKRNLPARMRVVPEGKTGESTEIVYLMLEFDPKLADDFFSLRTLQK